MLKAKGRTNFMLKAKGAKKLSVEGHLWYALYVYYDMWYFGKLTVVE